MMMSCAWTLSIASERNDASRTVIDDLRVILEIVASLTDDSRVVIYDHVFIVQATGEIFTVLHFIHNLMGPIRLHYARKACQG